MAGEILFLPAKSKSHRRPRKEPDVGRILNTAVVAYRWPAETDQSLTVLTETVAGKAITRSDGRKGWVLTILFRYGLSMYEAGKLPLHPQPKVVKMSLGW